MMSSLATVLNTASRALAAQQEALQVTAQNVSGANMPGYSRQRVLYGQSVADGGVVVMGVARATNPVLDRQLLQLSTSSSQAGTKQQSLEYIQTIFSEPSAGSLSGLLDEFWAGWQQVSNTPTSQAARVGLLQKATALTDIFQRVARDITSYRTSLHDQASQAVNQLNDLSEQIANINVDLARVQKETIQANGLRDLRDEKLRQLAGLAAITVQEDPLSGASTVLVGGRILISGEQAEKVSMIPTGGTFANPAWPDGTPFSLGAGAIAAYVDARDNLTVQQVEELDQLAEDLATALNAVHAGGYGLDGSTGQDFFLGSGAGDLRVNPALLSNPSAIAAAQEADAPGDSRNALAIYNLAHQAVAKSGTLTIAEAYQTQLSSLGTAVVGARDTARQQELVQEHLHALRQDVSGVSLDEEMVALVRYQNAYSVTARLIDSVNQIMDYLVRTV